METLSHRIVVIGSDVIVGAGRIRAHMKVNPGIKIQVNDLTTNEIVEAYPETLKTGYHGIAKLLLLQNDDADRR